MKLLKRFKSRKYLIRERDYYKEQFEKEKQQSDALKCEIRQIESEVESLQEENKKYELEKTAMRNIISEEQRKTKRTCEKMQKRINKLTAKLSKYEKNGKINEFLEDIGV